MLYFGVLSSVTPPVALSAFAAAPIAGAKPMETGWAAVRLAAPGFIIPFVFVFHPDILLIVEVLRWRASSGRCVAFALSTWGLVTGMVGWEGQPLPLWQRALRLVAGIAVLSIEPARRHRGGQHPCRAYSSSTAANVPARRSCCND